MKKLSFLFCVCICFSAVALDISEAHEKVIENTVKHYENILKQDFTTNISCPQIFGWINMMLAAQAKAANAPKNIPVPTINSVRRVHNAKKNSDKYTLNWGKQLPKEMADKLTEGLDANGGLDTFSEFCSALTLDGLKDIAEYASDNTCRLINENPNQFVVSIVGLDEELIEGIKIIGADICFNKRFSIVDSAKLKLLGGKLVEISIVHQRAGGEANKSLGAVPARIIIKNNLQKQVGGFVIPPQLNFNLSFTFQNRDNGMGMP